MSKYRKLIAAAVGLGVMVLTDVFGFSAMAGMEETVVGLVVAVATSLGVWAIPNEPT